MKYLLVLHKNIYAMKKTIITVILFASLFLINSCNKNEINLKKIDGVWLQSNSPDNQMHTYTFDSDAKKCYIQLNKTMPIEYTFKIWEHGVFLDLHNSNEHIFYRIEEISKDNLTLRLENYPNDILEFERK